MIEIWGNTLANTKVLFKTDNMAVVDIINKQTCKEPVTMGLTRRLVLAALRYNIVFKALHIPGKTNLIPDYLSRSKLQEAKNLAPWLDTAPTPVPAELLLLPSINHREI